MKNLWKNRLFLPFVLLIITLITYINILPNKLFFDDEELIYKNIYIQDFRYFTKYFTQNMIAGAGKTSNMYRPMLLTSFAIDYSFWRNNALGYHLTSIMLHFLNSLLIFVYIKYLFKNKFLAFIVSTLFIVHPIQVESIAYASGRTDPLYTFFSLISAGLFFNFLKTGRYSKYFLSLILFVSSLLSKEVAIMLPLILIIVLCVIPVFKDVKFKGLKCIVPFVMLDILYIALRLSVLNFGNTLNFYTKQNLYSQNIFVRLFSFCKVFFDYIAILFFPKDLIIARKAQIISSFWNVWVISFILVFIGLAAMSIYLFRKRIYIPLFSFLLFILTMLPVSGVIPINNIIAEHYLYLPSVSFFLFFSWLGFEVSKKQNKYKWIFFVLFSFIATVFSIRTIYRNFDWRDPITFYTISLKQSPGHIPMLNNLAMAYQDTGKVDLAINIYKQIVATSDVYPEPHINLGNAYKNSGKFKEAEEEYREAIKINPNFIYSYLALYDLYKKAGEQDELLEITKTINGFHNYVSD